MVLQGLYTGVKYEILDVTDTAGITDIDNYLQGLVNDQQEQSVVSIFMCPQWLAVNQGSVVSDNFTVSKPTTILSYTPRNKKLLTYPYSFMCIDTGSDSHVYKYEKFTPLVAGSDATFRMYGTMLGDPEIIVAPVNYNGSNLMSLDDRHVNFTEKVTMNGWPQCAFTIDAYRAWLAQKAAGEGIGIAAAIAGAIAGIVAAPETGGVSLTATIASMGAIAGQVNQAVHESTKGSTARGSIGSSATVAARAHAVYVKKMGVTLEYARIIDDYFDRFGYACNRIKVPGRANRPYWTYVKTRGCTIKGGVPANYARKICDIYDKGITWWRSPGLLGDYSQDNSPAS